LNKRSASKPSVSDARKKLHHQAFAYLLNEANMEKEIEPLWKECRERRERRVRIVDGTKMNTPNSKDLKDHFAISNTKVGPGYYPQA